MAKTGDLVVGLDIGTTKVCTLIAEVNSDALGRVDVLGVGVAPSLGLRRGVVVDIEQTVRAIRESVDRAQRMAGAEVHSVIVGVTGEHITSLNSRGVIAITHSDRQVTQDDVDRVLENSRVIVLPPDREIIHAIPRGFSLDGQNGIRSPVGMSGTRLEVETHIVTGATSFLRNVITCVERAGLHVEETVLEPIATAEAVLMNAERDMGVALVDIGGGTADLAIFRGGDICYSAVIPVGGSYVTKDISAGLRTTLEEAERIKVEHGTARNPATDALVPVSRPAPEKPKPANRPTVARPTRATGAEENADPADEPLAPDEPQIEVLHLGATEPAKVPLRYVGAIIEPRVTEMLHMIRHEINRANYAGRLPAGVVLSGGGSLLSGLPSLATEILETPVRIGVPTNVGGLAETVSAPPYATAVGLVQWGGRIHFTVSVRPQGSLFTSIAAWMRRAIRDAAGG